jgi:ATP-dependent 26S proteasome regulatory subunit
MLSLKRKRPLVLIGMPASFTDIRCSGLFAIRDYRDAVNQDDFNKAVRKVAESKKLEGKLEYQKL